MFADLRWKSCPQPAVLVRETQEKGSNNKLQHDEHCPKHNAAVVLPTCDQPTERPSSHCANVGQARRRGKVACPSRERERGCFLKRVMGSALAAFAVRNIASHVFTAHCPSRAFCALSKQGLLALVRVYDIDSTAGCSTAGHCFSTSSSDHTGGLSHKLDGKRGTERHACVT